jgi:hypothetical protein
LGDIGEALCSGTGDKDSGIAPVAEGNGAVEEGRIGDLDLLEGGRVRIGSRGEGGEGMGRTEDARPQVLVRSLSISQQE